MRKYHVYGLGNALVDIEYEVRAEQLQALDIEKGVMTLVDEEQQDSIISQLVGKESKKGGGGSAANTIIAMSQFGGHSFYSCKVADDEMGRFYIEDLWRTGVDTNVKPDTLDKGITGKCLVFVTPDADRTMNTYLGISSEFSEADIVADAIMESEYLYIEGYLVTGEASQVAAVRAREIAESHGVKTAVSLSDPNMVKFFKPGLLNIIGGGVDLLFANEEEAMGMAAADSFSEMLTAMKKLAKQFVITCGAKGSVIYNGQELLEIAPVQVEAVDTVGAGDMFAGAYLYGITHDMGVQRSGELASLAAATVVSDFGPRLEAQDVKKLLTKV